MASPVMEEIRLELQKFKSHAVKWERDADFFVRVGADEDLLRQWLKDLKCLQASPELLACETAVGLLACPKQAEPLPDEDFWKKKTMEYELLLARLRSKRATNNPRGYRGCCCCRCSSSTVSLNQPKTFSLTKGGSSGLAFNNA